VLLFFFRNHIYGAVVLAASPDVIVTMRPTVQTVRM
jgi:hypothetical protein